MTQTLSALLVSLTALLSSLGGGIAALNITPAHSQLAQVVGTEPNVINRLTSFWNTNTVVDGILWDHKSNAHGVTLNTTTATVPSARINPTGLFTFAVWSTHGSGGSILNRWGYDTDPKRSFSWAYNTNTNGAVPVVSFMLTDGTKSYFIAYNLSINVGERSLLWFAYDPSTNTLMLSKNGGPWTTHVPSAPFQSNILEHDLQIFGNGNAQSVMYWNGYIPTDAERSLIYNGGTPREFTYFNPAGFTPPARPLSVTDQGVFASDTQLTKQGLYWLRPFPVKFWSQSLRDSFGYDYVWVRSKDHAACGGAGDAIYLGGSNSPTVLPTSWTEIVTSVSLSAADPNKNWCQMHTPHLEYNPDTGTVHLYQGAMLDPYNSQWSTHVWTSTNLSTWTWKGEALPNTGTSGYNHTGYAVVKRISANVWKAASLLTDSTHPPVKFGLWTSTNGINWTFAQETIGWKNSITSGLDRWNYNGGYLVNDRIAQQSSEFWEAEIPFYTLFTHGGTGTNGDWLQDVRSYEENGKVYVYAKWSFKEPSTIRLFTGTLNTSTPPPPSVPSISSFSASPASISAGSSATLSWNTTGATSITLTPGNLSTALSGSVSVTPSVTTTYTLTATNSVGSVTSQSTVTVSPVVPPPVVDTTAPTAPTALSASSITQTSATLSWSASTDNVAVTGYNVFRNGTQVKTVSSTSYTDSSLSSGTAYTYSVSAYDAVGNQSLQSLSTSFTTLSTPPPPSTLSIGSRIKTTSKLKVRATPTATGKALCTQNKSALGTIIGGPVTAGGYIWWNLNYDTLCDGWSVQDYLLKQ